MIPTLEHFINKEVIVESEGRLVLGTLVQYDEPQTGKKHNSTLILASHSGLIVLRSWDVIKTLASWREVKMNA